MIRLVLILSKDKISEDKKKVAFFVSRKKEKGFLANFHFPRGTHYGEMK